MVRSFLLLQDNSTQFVATDRVRRQELSLSDLDCEGYGSRRSVSRKYKSIRYKYQRAKTYETQLVYRNTSFEHDRKAFQFWIAYSSVRAQLDRRAVASIFNIFKFTIFY